MSAQRSKPLGTLLLHGVLALAAAAMLVPFVSLLWMAFRVDFWLPGAVIPAGQTRLDVALSNFATLFATSPVWGWLMNSLFLACTTTALVVALSSLGGFALAKHRFAGRRTVIWLLIAVLMLPGHATLPASYELMHQLGWLNTYWALIVPGAVSAFGTLLFRSAMQGVPDELLQAARIDGAGELRLWWDVALPCVRPMVGAFTLLVFTGAWNAFLWPQIILSDGAAYTLPIGVANYAGVGDYESNYGVMMAATLLGILPVAALFLVLQRDFVAGLTSGAVKG